MHLGIQIYPGHKQHRLHPGCSVLHPAISAYRCLSHLVKESMMVKIQTELEYHGHSLCLQELTHSLESAFELGCRPRRASPLRRGMVVKNKKKTKAERIIKQRSSNSSQLPVGLLRPLHQKHSFGQNLVWSWKYASQGMGFLMAVLRLEGPLWEAFSKRVDLSSLPLL